MKNRLTVIATKLKFPVTTHVVAASAGAIGGAAVLYYYMMTNGHTLVLPKEAYDALVNDETNFVRFAWPKHEHAFRVSLEQWI